MMEDLLANTNIATASQVQDKSGDVGPDAADDDDHDP